MLCNPLRSTFVAIRVAMAKKRKQLQGGMDVQPDCFTAKHPKAASDHAPTEPKSPKSYFLIKSEADVFSIDDLASRPEQTEPWDGVRNHQAKKILQQMRTGDEAMFWSSNCKQPGIVGIVHVVREFYPDPLQFDPKAKYYDATASQETPRWFCVDVKLVRKLQHPITLAELKVYQDGELADMALFKMKRLSVQPVSLKEWEFILGLEKQ